MAISERGRDIAGFVFELKNGSVLTMCCEFFRVRPRVARFGVIYLRTDPGAARLKHATSSEARHGGAHSRYGMGRESRSQSQSAKSIYRKVAAL